MTEIKTLDQVGREFMAQEEGIKLKPYRDSAGIPTIGIGCTFYPDGRRVTMKDPPLPDVKAAWKLFDKVNSNFLLTVYSTTRDDINQNQFNALLALCFNIGPGAFKSSTVLRLVNKNPNDPAIADAFYMWRYSTVDGVKKPVLAGRRKREAALYFSNFTKK
jgi:lysozyme